MPQIFQLSRKGGHLDENVRRRRPRTNAGVVWIFEHELPRVCSTPLTGLSDLALTLRPHVHLFTL